MPYPGFSRDIVGAGFVKEVAVDGASVVVDFSPNSRNAAKVEEMENGIRETLREAKFADISIRTTHPFKEEDLTLSGSAMNPLQAELSEAGIAPEPDVLRNDLQHPDIAPLPGGGDTGPRPIDGPHQAGSLTYDGALPVFQWDIDPHNPEADSSETVVRMDDWEFRVWWQVHQCKELVYATLQAMREDASDPMGAARLHPVGRTEAVNLVYDATRGAVVAIYGTVRDFRPFVEAFRRGYVDRSGESLDPASQEVRA